MKKVLIGGLVVLTLGFFAVTFGKINMYNANKVNSNDKNNSKIIEVSNDKSIKINNCIKEHEYIKHITNDLKGKIEYDDKTSGLNIEVNMKNIKNNVNDKTKNENMKEDYKEGSVDFEIDKLGKSEKTIKEYIKNETGIDVKVNVSIIE